MKQAARITTTTARQVLEHHFDRKPTCIHEIVEGQTNFVFDARIGREELILRISNKPTKLQAFIKEQWVVSKARAKNVPAPEILEVGNDVIALPYMISRKVVGDTATGRGENLDVFREMGRYAAIINRIATSDFGHIFDWSPNQLSRCRSWHEFVLTDFKVEERVETFAQHRILTPARLKKLKVGVKNLLRLRGTPTLNHGDLRLKNVVLDGKGQITAILDWEHATSNLAPHWELAIALHDLGIDQKEAFLSGYGLSLKEFGKISPMVRVLNLLHYASVVKKAFQHGDRDRLLRLKQRLNGAFDLYSL
jgi:aminoglycoside phosphotransferase (APT) family kinase protein